MVLLVLALCSCRTDTVRPSATAPAPDGGTTVRKAPGTHSLEEERDLATQVYGEAVERHGGYLALAGNAGDQRSTLKRLTLGLEVFQARVRFPGTPDVAGVEQSLRALAAKLALPVTSLRITLRRSARRLLPAEVADGTAVTLTADDVRGVLDVELALATPPTAEGLARFAKETIELPRLVCWASAESVAQDGAPALLLRGEAYWFFADTVVPKVAHRPPRLEEVLERLGLAANPKDAAARAVLDKARALFAEMAENLNDYLGVLELIRQSRLVKARLAVVREARARQDAAVGALRPSP